MHFLNQLYSFGRLTTSVFLTFKQTNMNQLYKIRCRNNGIIVTDQPEKYNVVWCRAFNPAIFSMDKPNQLKNP